MITIRGTDDLRLVPDTSIRHLIQQRIDSIASEEPFDAAEHGYFLVLEAGDSMDAINEQVGFDILCNRWSGHRFDHPDYRPAFEVLEEHENCFDLLFILDDSGFGVELLIPTQTIAIPELLAMCQHYAVPGTF